MKSARIAVAFAAMIVAALALAVPVSAATVVVPANDFYIVEVDQFFGGGPIMQGSDLSFTWSSDRPLTLAVSGPSGLVEYYPSSNHGSDTIDITETGTYYLTWTNGAATDASLTYDCDVDPFAPAEDFLDAILVGVLVLAIVIVVVIVLVVVFVVRAEKPEQPAQTQPQF